jgi:hypothetical protein
MPRLTSKKVQERFYEIMDAYNGGDEPLENWDTSDLVSLANCIDCELQRRSPPDVLFATGDFA